MNRLALAPLLVVLALACPAAAQDERRTASGLDAEQLTDLLLELAVKSNGRHTRWTPTLLKNPRDVRAAEQAVRMLDGRKITVNFDDAPFDEALDFVREVTGLNIAVSKEAAKALEETRISLRLRDVRLRSCFELLLELAHDDLRYGIRHGVLWLDLARAWPKEMILRIIDVADLIKPLPDFPAPRLGLKGLEED